MIICCMVLCTVSCSSAFCHAQHTYMCSTELLHGWVSMQIWCCCWCTQEVNGSFSLRSAMYSTHMCPIDTLQPYFGAGHLMREDEGRQT